MKVILNHFIKVILISIVMWLLSSITMYLFEHNTIGSNITTFGDALWWSVITLTTIAYGDKYPITTAGKIFAVIVVIFGIGTFSILVSKISALFISEEKEEQIDEIKKDIEEIDHKIDLIIEHDNKERRRKMKLELTTPHFIKRNSYKLIIEFAHGGEDNLITNKIIYVSKKHEDKLIEFMTVLSQCCQYDSECFDSLSKWHYDYDEDTFTNGDIYFEFPNDLLDEFDEPSLFHSYKLTYLDEDGREHDVKLTDEEE